MISEKKIPIEEGKFLVCVYAMLHTKSIIFSSIQSSEILADRFVANKQKEIILKKIKEFLHHREKSLTFSQGLTLFHTNAIEKILNHLQFNNKQNLPHTCQAILHLQEDIMKLMPGQQSEFYEHWTIIINEVFTFCEQKVHRMHKLKPNTNG